MDKRLLVEIATMIASMYGICNNIINSDTD